MALRNLIGEVLDGKYRIERQLGEGGMGAVYFATHLGTERPVALKVIAPQFMKHDEFVERFRREARAAGRMRHPNVVDVTDFGFARVDTDQVAYLVMEYLDGCTLNEILDEEASLPLSWVIDILEQTCSAVDEAHQQGIVHRDLKPDNIWLEPNRRGGYTVKVLDFGIAKLDDPVTALAATATANLSAPIFDSAAPTQASESPTLLNSPTDTYPDTTESSAATELVAGPSTDANLFEAGTQIFEAEEDLSEAGTRMFQEQSLEEMGTSIFPDRTTDKAIDLTTGSAGSLTRVGSILGTPLYMSPEQCRGESLDARADIYSLGVIAYKMLSGHTPFAGDVSTVIRSHREVEPPPLSVKHVPPKLTALVMSALSKTPDLRPPTAAAFARALRAHSEGAGSLLRRSLTIYAEYLPTFLKLAALVYAPVVITTVLQSAFKYMATRQVIPKPWGDIASAVAAILNVLVTFFSASVIVGITTWLVTQILAMPSRPLQLRPAFAALKKRLRPFLKTALALSFAVMGGFALCFFPGLFLVVAYALTTPVLAMENLRGHGAFLRARELVSRAPGTVTAIVFIHIGIPILLSAATALLITAVVKALNPGGFKESVTVVNLTQQIVLLPFTILLSSIASVVTALLYWKTRLAGGESLRDAFNEFAREEVPASQWRQKMLVRLQTPIRTGSRDSRNTEQ